LLAGGLNFGGGRLDPSNRPAADGDASSTTTALESESLLDQDVSDASTNEDEPEHNKYGHGQSARARRHSSAQQPSQTQMRSQLEELEEIYSQARTHERECS
jgi:hypothetical protein